ncbi:MAG: TonB-dependent receptor plug domain-containing protein, partial [Bacteroidales bacterium]|nr:TonB-dependent receptor plug domain-containing protein [Bacteroidales bacterium]
VASYGQLSIPDSLASLFFNQLTVFPQEKIYVHTDKPYYLSGERIWFRAYLTDAISHVPAPVSRYVYVELINPLDSVVTRVKVREEAEAYHGYLSLPDDIPQGIYTLRAYTTFMLSQEENYFFTGTLHIGDPQARSVNTETLFFFEPGGRVHATFSFSHVSTSAPLVPQSVRVGVNDGMPMSLRVESDGTATLGFDLPAGSRRRTLLLEVTADKYPYRQFIQVPAPDNDFDVGFYPEGGSLLLGTPCKIVFKAMKSDGQATDITGTIYDRHGVEVGEIRSDYLGMGSFVLLAEQGKSYYAVCENDRGQSKRFDLPVAIDYGYSLSVHQMRNQLYISVRQPAGVVYDEDLYLLAHTRGMIHLIDFWDHEKNLVVIPKELFPSGVLHLILFDAGFNPVSERLVFINNPDQAQVSYLPDRTEYARRSLVNNSLTVTDADGRPLTGSFSVSVTSDREVSRDTTTNILTQLLLTSDLRGHIEHPAFYFQNSPESNYALDLLMCTQGWRRYDIAELAQGRFSRPSSPLEFGSEISGTVKGLISSRPVGEVEVTVVSLAGDYFGSVHTDSDGRFSISVGELPDSTRYVVSAAPKRGMTNTELVLDGEVFPDRTLAVILPSGPDKRQFARYADKAEQQYVYEGGIRVTELSAAVVTAQRVVIPPRKSQYYAFPDNSLTEEELDQMRAMSLFNIMSTFPGLQVLQGESGQITSIIIRGFSSVLAQASFPLVLMDGIPVSNPREALALLHVHDIAQIDVLKSAGNTSVFGYRGGHGVIVIHTRDRLYHEDSPLHHIRTLLPLGYQQPVEFYVPVYDTPAKRDALTPDLRTTIHWQPVVQIDNRGVASFAFYTADENTSYTVIIEGLCNDGTIIRQETKLW